MHRRHQNVNIPTEIIRTLVAIAKNGSFSKAGKELNLSQSAISAQVKRLQMLVGGPVFSRVSGGVVFTELGSIVLAHARKLLAANDQILSLGGGQNETKAIRIGLSPPYVERFLKIWSERQLDNPVAFFCENSSELANRISEGFIDIACVVNAPAELNDMETVWLEEYVWVRSPDFLLSPGKPIPLVSWPGSPVDLPVLNALQKAGMAYRVVFASSDRQARFAAVAAGLGLLAMPKCEVPDGLIIALEYYLPALDPLRAGIVLSAGIDKKVIKEITEALTELAPEEHALKQIS